MSDQKVFETRNAYVAAILTYAGLVLLEVKRIGPKSLNFVFLDDDESAAQLEADFWADRQITSQRSLLEAYSEIRKEIYKALQS